MSKSDQELKSLFNGINNIPSTTNNNNITPQISTSTSTLYKKDAYSDEEIPLFKTFKVANRSINPVKPLKIDGQSFFPTSSKKRVTTALSSYGNLKKEPFKLEFSLGDYTWQLLFIPNASIDNKPCLSVYLISNSSLTSKKSIKADFAIELVNFQDGSTYLKCKSFEFSKNQPYTGFLDYMGQSEMNIDKYYQDHQTAFYFTVIVTIDIVMDDSKVLQTSGSINFNGLSSVSTSTLTQYQKMNDLLNSNIKTLDGIDYYRSMIISLLSIPMIKSEILRLDFNSPTRMYYQLQRTFFYFDQGKEIKDNRLYKAIKFFLSSNSLNQFEFSKILEEIIIEIVQNSPDISLKWLFPSVIGDVFDKKYMYNAKYEDQVNSDSIPFKFDSIKGSSNLDFDSSDGIVFQINTGSGSGVGSSGVSSEQIIDKDDFVRLLISSNKTLSNKSSMSTHPPPILHVSLINRTSQFDLPISKMTMDSLNKCYNCIKYPQEFQIGSNEYSIYSVWAYEKPEYGDGKGTTVTYIREFNNNEINNHQHTITTTDNWTKIKSNSIESISSFDHVVQQTCGIERDRVLLGNIKIDLPRDITFSYMIVYILKSKINEMFNYQPSSPLPNAEDFNIQDNRKNDLSAQPFIPQSLRNQESQLATADSTTGSGSSTATPLTNSTSTFTPGSVASSGEIDRLTQKIRFLEEKNKQLTKYQEKVETLESTCLEKDLYLLQLESEAMKVERLEKQLLFLDKQFKKLLFDEQDKWKRERSRLYSERDTAQKENDILLSKTNRFKKEREQSNTDINYYRKEIDILKQERSDLNEKVKSGNGALTNPIAPYACRISDISLDMLSRQTLEEVLDVNRACQKALDLTAVALVRKYDELLCVICTELPRKILFLPCRHLCTCTACSDVLNICPLCRKEINQKVQVANL